MSTELATAPSSAILLRPLADPATLIEVHKEAAAVIVKVLDEGKDYGIIPGTDDKKNLLKPGAERLVGAFGLVAEYEILEKEIDHNYVCAYKLPKWVDASDPGRDEKERIKALGLGRNKKIGNNWKWQLKEEEVGESYGVYRYVIQANLSRGGVRVGQGVGSCSSMESKYIRNPRDAENTVLKMAKKRAFVDAVLTTLGLSDRFSQDHEDIVSNQAAAEVVEPEEAATQVVENPRGRCFAVMADLGLPPHEDKWKPFYYGYFARLLEGAEASPFTTLSKLTDPQWTTILRHLEGFIRQDGNHELNKALTGAKTRFAADQARLQAAGEAEPIDAEIVEEKPDPKECAGQPASPTDAASPVDGAEQPADATSPTATSVASPGSTTDEPKDEVASFPAEPAGSLAIPVGNINMDDYDPFADTEDVPSTEQVHKMSDEALQEVTLDLVKELGWPTPEETAHWSALVKKLTKFDGINVATGMTRQNWEQLYKAVTACRDGGDVPAVVVRFKKGKKGAA